MVVQAQLRSAQLLRTTTAAAAYVLAITSQPRRILTIFSVEHKAINT